MASTLDGRVFENGGEARLTTSIPATVPERARCVQGVDWNSVWFLIYSYLFYLGWQVTIWSFVVYGTSDLSNDATRSTCGSHADIGRKVCEEAFEVFWATLTLVYITVRKSRDPYLLGNYCGGRVFADLCCLPRRSRVRVFVCLLCTAFLVVGTIYFYLIWSCGSCPTKNMMYSVTFSGIALFVYSVLNHQLQVDCPRVPATLEMHWFWAMASVALTWGLGFLFYLSVDFSSFEDTDSAARKYETMVFHAIIWAVFLSLTYCKFENIFGLRVKGAAGSQGNAVPSSIAAEVGPGVVP